MSNPMNNTRFEQLWDEMRDGTISAEGRAAFEEHLRTNESAAAMWKAESQWLEALADVDASFEGETNVASAASFTESVLNQWQPQSPVLGRIGFGRMTGWAIGIAAMVAFFILGAIYSNVLNVPNPTGPSDPAIAKGNGAATESAPDAIGLLMSSAKENYALAAAGQQRLKQGFTETAAFFDVSRLATLFDPGVPDPAEFVEPKTGG